MIKAVLFDYGGVLSKGGRSIRHDIADALGIADDRLDFLDVNDKFRRGKITADEFFQTLEKRHNGDGSLQEKLLSRTDFFQREDSIYSLASRLRKHDIKTAIFSNVYQPAADKLRTEGLYDEFYPVLLSCEEGFAKPDVEFYQKAINLLEVLPQEILLIDDQEKCLIPAREFGMKTIQSVSPEQVVDDTEKMFVNENGITL